MGQQLIQGNAPTIRGSASGLTTLEAAIAGQANYAVGSQNNNAIPSQIKYHSSTCRIGHTRHVGSVPFKLVGSVLVPD